MNIHTIAEYDPEFQHGVSLCWHKDKLYASYAHNWQGENTPAECAMLAYSEDLGQTWHKIISPLFDGFSHGAIFSTGNYLFLFSPYIRNGVEGADTAITVLDHEGLQPKIIKGFWPSNNPQLMNNGSWIMPGFATHGQYCAAVAISNGSDITRWDVVEILPRHTGRVWGESALMIDQTEIWCLYRDESSTLGAVERVSYDCGLTWVEPIEISMSRNKPCAGTLSNGLFFSIIDGDLRIDDMFYTYIGQRVRYPSAVERDGKLYIGYSDNECRAGLNQNAIKLAVITL